ncbi:N-acetyltransferase [Rugamonas sp. DEMB1]|uniref:N-acetyltransferase n=1 Tax=Rugamonas sp. DEMB1 TaxID=3039386 RepID=UPI00244CA8A5|nr:N-acetyltransferase [Rugamonas sp. DEMB1]WGG52023.1 N-acetyltransferase [Rugamonas sp. DEMB1]
MTLILAPDYIVPLQKGHDRDTFDCGNEELNRYLKRQARQDADKFAATPFVLVEADTSIIRAYYTLSSSLAPLAELPAELVKKLPRYQHLPVTLLGRLARDKTIPNKGVGEYLLIDALRRSLEGAQEIAAMAVVVDAKNPDAERFYRHFNFLPLQRTPHRLFLPMRQIAQLFG